METSQASRESNMPTDDQDRHHPYLIPSDSTWVPSPAIATRQSSRKDVRTLGLNAQNSTGLRPLGSDPTNYESHFGFGGARCLVWATLIEAGLVIAGLLCWQLIKR
jgi:hypothetical protein